MIGLEFIGDWLIRKGGTQAALICSDLCATKIVLTEDNNNGVSLDKKQ